MKSPMIYQVVCNLCDKHRNAHVYYVAANIIGKIYAIPSRLDQTAQVMKVIQREDYIIYHAYIATTSSHFVFHYIHVSSFDLGLYTNDQ